MGCRGCGTRDTMDAWDGGYVTQGKMEGTQRRGCDMGERRMGVMKGRDAGK